PRAGTRPRRRAGPSKAIVRKRGRHVHAIPANRAADPAPGCGCPPESGEDPGRHVMDSHLDRHAPAALRPVLRRAEEAETNMVLGMRHAWLLRDAETGGAFGLFEDLVPPGSGAPPHTHRSEDETFVILSGEMTLEIEGRDAPL